MECQFRPLTSEEQELGRKAGIPTPHFWNAFIPSEAAVWCALENGRMFKDDDGKPESVWASQILHIREQFGTQVPKLWGDVSGEGKERTEPEGWVCSELRSQFRETHTRRRDMVIGGASNALVYDGETLFLAKWGRGDHAPQQRKGEPVFLFIVGEEVAENVSRLRGGGGRRFHHGGPRRSADHVRPTGRTVELPPRGASLTSDGPIGAVEPVAAPAVEDKKVTVETAGGWAADAGRPIVAKAAGEPGAASTEEAPAETALAAPKVSRPKIGLRPTVTAPRAIGAAPRAASKPKLISAAPEAEKAETKTKDPGTAFRETLEAIVVGESSDSETAVEA